MSDEPSPEGLLRPYAEIPRFRGEVELDDGFTGIDLAVIPEPVSFPPPSPIAPQGSFPNTRARNEGFFNFDDLTATDRGFSLTGHPIYKQTADQVREDGDDLFDIDLKVNRGLGRGINFKTKDDLMDKIIAIPNAERLLRVQQVVNKYRVPDDLGEDIGGIVRKLQRLPADNIGNRVSLRRFIGLDSLARRTIPRFYDLLGRGVRGAISQDNREAEEREMEEMVDAGFNPDDLEYSFDPNRERGIGERLQVEKIKSLKSRLAQQDR